MHGDALESNPFNEGHSRPFYELKAYKYEILRSPSCWNKREVVQA